MSESSMDQLGKVILNGDSASIEFQRYFPFPAEKVWSAITDNDKLASWFLTKIRIHPGPSGSVESWFGYPTLHVHGRIRVWDPPNILEHEWNLDPGPELPEGEFSIMRWELINQNGGTILKLTHQNLTRETLTGLRRGLDPAPAEHLILMRLNAYLAGSSGPSINREMRILMETYHRMLQRDP